MIFDHEKASQMFLYLDLTDVEPVITGFMYRETKEGDYEYLDIKNTWHQCSESNNPFLRFLKTYLESGDNFCGVKEKIIWSILNDWLRDEAPKFDGVDVDYSLYEKSADWIQSNLNKPVKTKLEDGTEYMDGHKACVIAMEAIKFKL